MVRGRLSHKLNWKFPQNSRGLQVPIKALPVSFRFNNILPVIRLLQVEAFSVSQFSGSLGRRVRSFMEFESKFEFVCRCSRHQLQTCQSINSFFLMYWKAWLTAFLFEICERICKKWELCAGQPFEILHNLVRKSTKLRFLYFYILTIYSCSGTKE